MPGSSTDGTVAERFKGLVLSIPTVFDGEGEVDVPAMEQLTEWYVGHGVHGFFVLGSKGQGPACRTDQRKLVAETVINQVRGRVPVVIQVGAVDPYTSMDLGAHARQAGADAIGLVGPYYYSDRSEWELIEQHKMVDAAAGLPMFLYNNPQYSGYPTTPEMMVKLREEIPGVFGGKLAMGSLEQALRYLRVLGKDFSMFIPIGHLLPGMLLGVTGCIAAGLPVVIPEIGVALVEALWAGDIARAQSIQLRLFESSERTVALRKYGGPTTTLVGLQLRGIPVKQYPRWPTRPMTDEHRALMERSIKQVLDDIAVPA